jgi:hypothetical protein
VFQILQSDLRRSKTLGEFVHISCAHVWHDAFPDDETVQTVLLEITRVV